MLPEQEQRMLGYFLEEAKDHLNTIEQGLLNLHSTLKNTEMINEVFRAAHSVKGGAAMLGLDSIQQTAHHLEDYFKVLKECPIQIDQKLESLFLRVFDTLKELIEHLENSFVLTGDVVDNIMSEVKPIFAALNQHLELLVNQSTDVGELIAFDSLFDEEDTLTATSESEFYNLFDDLEEFNHDYSTKDADSADLFDTHTALHELDAAEMDIGAMLWGTSFAHDTATDVGEAQTTSDGNNFEDFADLEGLLQEEAPSVEMFAEPEQETEIDEFSQLEALLDADTLTVLPVTQIAALSTIPDLSTGAATDIVDDEFADLEMLLEAASVTTTGVAIDNAAVKPAQTEAAAGLPRRPVFEQTMRVSVKHLDNVSNLVGELVVNRNSLEQEQQRLRQFLDNLLHQVHQLSNLGSRMQELYERSLMEASLINIRQSSRSASLDTAHVTGMDFDALEMDRFTGFHTLSQEMIELIIRMREATSDIEFVTDGTEQVARQFRQVTTQLQEGLTRSRMVPFSQIAERLPRAVRDIALKCGKQAELNIEGRETLIDKVILEQLYDPMTHLVNNSITHGIESPEERSAKGKSPVGQITIRAFYQGNQTIISVADDGAGIDTEQVKAKAIQKRLLSPDGAEKMSRLDVYNLLFHPGFSTKDQVDEFAGRGVGMDVVRTSLREIRGTINTDSTPDLGTTFTIRLPLTLSICKALCCLSDKTRIAFPLDGVEDMIDVPTADVIINEAGQICILWRDALLQFQPLKELLVSSRQLDRGNFYGSTREGDKISIVVLRSAGTFLAVQVDQVLGEQEIVIKQFEGPVPKPVGVAGATVLGDGRIMPIADVLELVDLSMGRLQPVSSGSLHTRNAAVVLPESKVKAEPTVLIVDDSITVRELLSMTFIKAGYRVEQARDGQEAWDKLQDGLPCDIVFCDIEMPRMDGLELLSRIQEEPSLSKLPIAMLTSRGADRHRQMAVQLGASGYFIKPYLEEALLDGAQRMLKGEVLLD